MILSTRSAHKAEKLAQYQMQPKILGRESMDKQPTEKGRSDAETKNSSPLLPQSPSRNSKCVQELMTPVMQTSSGKSREASPLKSFHEQNTIMSASERSILPSKESENTAAV